MKILLTIVFVALSACQSDQACDFVVDGLCVYQNDYTISIDKISWEIAEVEAVMNDHFPGLDLYALIDEYELSLSYVSDKDLGGNRGDYGNSGKELVRLHQYNPAPGDEDIQCMENYYVFGHELLHFISRHYLKVSDSDNKSHNVSGVFLKLDDNGELDPNNVELNIYLDTKDLCGFHYR